MGIGPHAIKLTRIIDDAGLLKPGFTVLELGSQDFAPTLPSAQDAVHQEFGYESISGIKVPADLYRRMGSSRYDCIDLDGYHGAHVFDLNVDIPRKYKFADTFDLVTNHGTTEHLFNQVMAFQNVHRLTKVGGVMLHALPCQGYQNHGMFNYNASLFLDLSIANGYEVFGLFLSIDDKLYAYDEEFFRRNNIASSQDTLIMAVMIKVKDAPFEVPYDGRYFSLHGKGEVQAFTEHVGTTSRSAFGGGKFEIAGLDHYELNIPESQHEVRFITPLWGASYVADYLSVTLPSQLTSGNLLSFGRTEAIYTIVTTEQDAALIRASSAYEDLARILEVEFIYHYPLEGEHAYQRMSRAYNLALARVKQPQVCFFLTGDDFYSDGLLLMAAESCRSGKRAVMVPTIRVVSETFKVEIENRDNKAIAPSELVGLMLRHEHPMITACVINDPSRMMHRLPSQTLYRLSDGYVGRWNVMHPLAVKLPSNPRPVTSTVDWNYPALHVSHRDEIHVVRNSDEGVIASLAEFGYSQNEELTRNGTKWRRIRNLKDWVNIEWSLNFHVLQMSEPVFLHATPLGDPKWKAAQREVDSVWLPFYRYIQRHRLALPEPARGYGMDLLLRAVKVSRTTTVMRLMRLARRRFVRKVKERLYNGISRRLSI